MNWQNRMRDLEKWQKSYSGSVPNFDVSELSNKFDSAVHLARDKITCCSDQLLVFMPQNWEEEEDWLLSAAQWRYLNRS